jgi:hypothetical protein
MREASARFLDDGLRAILLWYQGNPQAVRLGLWAHIQGDTRPWAGQLEQMGFVVRMLAELQQKGTARRDVPAFHLAMAIGGMAYYWFLFKQRYAPVVGVDPRNPAAAAGDHPHVPQVVNRHVGRDGRPRSCGCILRFEP